MNARKRRRWPALLAFLLFLPVLLLLAGWLLLRASLPELDGSLHLDGLRAAAFVDRDASGTVVLRSDDRAALDFALGFAHAQERFFEMDLLRRRAAGELAELLGPALLPADRSARQHRFRHRVTGLLGALEEADRARLGRYAEGVNAGLAALDARPFPYLLLRQEPRPWLPADALLAPIAMYFDLQGGHNERELRIERMAAALPPAVFDFLTARGSSWDAPILGGAYPDPPFPAPRDFDLREVEIGMPPSGERPGSEGIGSNQFAVAGSRSRHGGALLANDMHLGLRVPNIWFRTQLRYPQPEAPGGERVVTGLSLPGTPFIVVGSNGQIAWGFTNSYGDWLDFIALRTDPDDPERYLDDGRWLTIEQHVETIAVRGAEAESLRVRETRHGPVVAESSQGQPLALAWTAHHARGVNLGLGGLETAGSIESALEVARRTGMPAQNLMLADASGRIAWTLIGPIPLRSDYDPRLPSDWSSPGSGWNGWIDGDRQPAVLDPPEGLLWTANARVVNGQAQQWIGDGGYTLGARAAQIRDGLRDRELHDEKDLLAIQLDDRAHFLEPWRELLLGLLEGRQDEHLMRLGEALADWDGHASSESRAYRAVRAFRLRVHRRFLMLFEAPLRAQDPEWRWPVLAQLEGVVWKTIRERPAHLLPRNAASWDDWLLAAASDVASALPAAEDEDDGSWGSYNTSAIRHPLSNALPWLSWLLDMPAQPMRGDQYMPRVQGPRFGASQRMVVSPGREEQGILHMPGGQSGHPLSPFYGAGHQDWMEGRPSPFLPGETRHRLQLLPPRK